MISTREFAEKLGVNYRTALIWLQAGRVPGAIERQGLRGTWWEIPADAVGKVTKRKRGPKPAKKAGGK